ncbi:hypothetical protein D1164_19300 [Mariniphaga sediminis]|uniref:Uncharacterized protein n=1 Tax=Mariniphaga sediminis TaxID=1628158 RepID=A0A399CWH2_9BACT|nr:hypothetical protein D1164_19300 [Mariniphaga sediminis]
MTFKQSEFQVYFFSRKLSRYSAFLSLLHATLSAGNVLPAVQAPANILIRQAFSIAKKGKFFFI